VLVRCFSDKHKFDKEIREKLGSSFTRIPFIVVVVSFYSHLIPFVHFLEIFVCVILAILNGSMKASSLVGQNLTLLDGQNTCLLPEEGC
jgi:hypothetical protein